MIKQSLKDQVLHINIANLDFSYRIPTSKLGDITNWRIGENKLKGIVKFTKFGLLLTSIVGI